MRLSLDWMNLFAGLTANQITSVIVVAVIFTVASGLVLLSLIVFGVRAGLMAPTYSTRLPAASDVELGAFLGGAALGMVSILLMTFLGFAENDLDNPLFLPLAVGPILLGGLFFLSGAGHVGLAGQHGLHDALLLRFVGDGIALARAGPFGATNIPKGELLR